MDSPLNHRQIPAVSSRTAIGHLQVQAGGVKVKSLALDTKVCWRTIFNQMPARKQRDAHASANASSLFQATRSPAPFAREGDCSPVE